MRNRAIYPRVRFPKRKKDVYKRQIWKADGDTLTADREGCELFADGSAVQGADIWCDRQLARQPDGDRVDVRLVVEKAGQRRIIPVSVPNLKQPRLQQIGLRLCEKLHVRVLLRNGIQTVESQPVSLVGAQG